MKYLMLFSLLATIGCRRAHVRVQHPLETGTVAANVIRHGQNSAEITEFTADRICFDVRGSRETVDVEPLSGMQEPIKLHDGNTWRSDVDIAEEDPEQRTIRAGTKQVKYEAGTIQECAKTDPNDNRRCLKWVTKPRYEYRTVPADYYGVDFGGAVCFANNGGLTLDTRDITLVWTQQQYRWHFDSLADQ